LARELLAKREVHFLSRETDKPSMPKTSDRSRPSWRTRRLPLIGVLSLLVLLQPAGCSWLFVQPLPSNYEPGRSVPDCTTNRAAPVFDTIFTGTNIASAVYVAGENNVTNKGTAVTLGLLVASVWLSSAIYGYSKTSACEDAKAEDAPAPRYRPVYHLRAVPPAPPPAAVPPPAAPAGTVPAAPAGAVPAAPAPTQQQDDDDPGVRTTPRQAPPALPE
jgi:hypothetical protein